jgi:pyruvate/2-oxoglutarate dehydrogenase complex dihydrolipoamide dehydrogenase (E3) component
MGGPEQTDVVVKGLGPGGEYVAGTLAGTGLHVTGGEAGLTGGECPYFGCVPTKMMIRANNLIAETRRDPVLSGTSTPHPRPIEGRAPDTGDAAITGERLLIAVGRWVNLAALGVAAVGLDEKARSIPTDEWMRAADGV